MAYTLESTQTQTSPTSSVALGWFSIGLGLAEILAPRELSRLIGVDSNSTVIRSLGAREVLNGIGILAQPRSAGWMWARVAGDAMDLALLAKQLGDGSDREKTLAAIAAVVGVTIADIRTAQQLSSGAGNAAAHQAPNDVIHVSKVVGINRPAADLYQYWHDFENLPRFMTHLKSVRVTGDGQSHWIANAPAGKTVEWDAEVTSDIPNEEIAWRSLPGADVFNAGSVRFESDSGGRGSRVRVDLRYSPPAGIIGATLAKLFGEEPEQQVREDLRRFKQVMETGVVATTKGQSAGPRSTIATLAHSMNPAKKDE